MIKPVYLGRQPILDLKKNTFAYEILYRSADSGNAFPDIDGATATSQVLYNLFYGLDFREVVGGKKAFINFTKENLLQELPKDVDPSQVVIEVLEDVKLDQRTIEACKALKQKGYKIALDDFFIKEGTNEILPIADIVKIDWMNSSPEEIKELTDLLKGYDLHLLAEKVEKEEEYLHAVNLGYRYFQGYFFERPTIIKGEDVSPAKWTYLRLFTLIQRPELEPRDLAKVIKHDPALTFKLLRLINSAAFALPQEVNSVEQAIVLLGEKEMRRWLSLVVMANMCGDQPEELFVSASTRGRFGELVAEKIGRRDLAPSVFLLGMLSLLNTMMGRPMKELMNQIKVHPMIKDALLKRSGPMIPFLYLMIGYERANQKVLGKCMEYFKLDMEEITKCYIEAAKWSNSLRDLSV